VFLLSDNSCGVVVFLQSSIFLLPAFNRETKQFVPFQILSTRKRTEASAESAKVQVIVQAFDLMYLNGKSLLDHTLAERRELLRNNFVPIDGKFQFATSLDHTENGDTEVIEQFLDEAVKGQCEGLMVKTLDNNAQYKPSLRSFNWLKLKKDYLEGLGDSVSTILLLSRSFILILLDLP
jgi:DNA ligase-1